MDIEQLQKENDELRAHIERLRSVLKEYANPDNYSEEYVQYCAGPINGHGGYSLTATYVDWNAAEKALSETPTQSLNHIKAQVEEETIERYKARLKIKGYLVASYETDKVPRKYKEQSNGL